MDLTAQTLSVRASLARIEEQGLVIGETKSSKVRQVVLGQTAVEALRRHRATQLGELWEDHDLVFSNELGKPLEARNLLSRSFVPRLERAGLPRIRFHDPSHTAATFLLGQGTYPKIVSEMLGHSQISVTLELYSHVTPTMQRQAAAAMDAVLGS